MCRSLPSSNPAGQQHLVALKLQGKARKTIEAYAFSVRRIARHVDRCPDNLTADEFGDCFAALTKSQSARSGSTCSDHRSSSHCLMPWLATRLPGSSVSLTSSKLG